MFGSTWLMMVAWLNLILSFKASFIQELGIIIYLCTKGCSYNQNKVGGILGCYLILLIGNHEHNILTSSSPFSIKVDSDWWEFYFVRKSSYSLS